MPEAQELAPVIDMMEALKKSLALARKPPAVEKEVSPAAAKKAKPAAKRAAS